jgi:hypothetical protein
MKITILISSFLFSSFCFSQDSTIVLSKYEKFFSETGKMYKTETKEIGKVKDITISLVKTTEVSSGQSISAIQIFQKNMMMFTPISLGVLHVDIDEIEGVARALKYYQEEIKKGKPQYQSSYYYLTSNDIQVSCSYFEGSFGGWFVSLSQRYHYIKTTVSGSLITIKNKDIDDLVELIEKSKDSKF